MTIPELIITKICDGDETCRPVLPVWILASMEYGVMEIAELYESIRIARN
jgi:hypothetical protein